MLSRLATASRLGAKALQAARPGRQLLYTSSKAATLVDTAAWNEAYVPAPDAEPKSIWQQYKDVAGESAGSVFLGSLAVYLLSKEVYIINEETYLAALMAFTVGMIVKKAGPGVSDYFEGVRQEQLAKLNKEKESKVESINDQLTQISAAESLLDTRADLFNVVKVNNEMALEVQYREHLKEVETEVKKRLDYQIDLQNLKDRIEHEHIAKWVEDAVVQSITPEQEEEAIAKCIADIEALAQAQHA